MKATIWLSLSLLSLGACARPAQAAPPVPSESRIQDWVLRDADALRARMEHLRRQILARTRTADDARYQQLRPKLARQLVARGLPPEDAEAILTDVDAARGRR